MLGWLEELVVIPLGPAWVVTASSWSDAFGLRPGQDVLVADGLEGRPQPGVVEQPLAGQVVHQPLVQVARHCALILTEEPIMVLVTARRSKVILAAALPAGVRA
jgi:hypothetical protein